MPSPDPLVESVESLQNILIATATGGCERDSDCQQLRRDLIDNPLTKAALPRFVHTNRNLSQFWQFIKYEFGTYAERRQHIWGAFRPLLDALESRPNTPVELSDEHLLRKLSPEAVQTVWARALERRVTDPEGAITAARALLESVCKHILDDLSVAYDDAADLP